MVYEGELGTCCEAMVQCMTTVPEPFFRVEDNGVLYMTVGFEATDQGPAFYDHAILFCPFCGEKLQDRDEIASMAELSE
jgi:hypothetical protein